MSTLSIILLIVASVGTFGMTWLWPLSARCLRNKKGALSAARVPGSIAILIPVHNDARKLAPTLRSITAAISAVPSKISILVCPDHCTDNSAEVAQSAEARLVSNDGSQGKWQALRALINNTDSEWIGLVDAGAIWPTSLLRSVSAAIDSDVVAVAPAYANQNCGIIEKALWFIERNIKALEARAGGPVAVHGATVFYLREALLNALKAAGEQVYSNDDVVIPLLLRANDPSKRVVYLKEVVVTDIGVRAEARDFGRRLRIVLGNLDWVRELFPSVLRADLSVALLALRRIFRIFWVYWIFAMLLAFLSIAVSFSAVLTMGIIALPALLLCSRSLRGACLASLLAPYYLLFPIPREARRWQ